MTKTDAQTVREETAGQMLQRLGMDGMLWSIEMHKRFPQVAQDDLLGWCCNMIMAGYDKANRRAAQRLVEGWQPIETAPKDGTDILVYSEGGSGIWPRMASWCRSEINGNISEWWGLDRANIGVPTHWMHLPTPPTTSEE